MSIQLMSAIFYHTFEKKSVMVTRKGNLISKTVASYSQKLVMLALADHANDQGEGAYPALTTLVKKTNMTRATVSVTLRALKESGYLCRIGMSRLGTTNYTIALRWFTAYTSASLRRKPEVVYSVNPNHPKPSKKTSRVSYQSDELPIDERGVRYIQWQE